MRIAFTKAELHSGAWEQLAGPEVPISQQLQSQAERRGVGVHPKFARVIVLTYPAMHIPPVIFQKPQVVAVETAPEPETEIVIEQQRRRRRV